MSFSYNEQTWVPESTAEHAQSMMSTINTLLQENNITDDEGNVVQLSENFANAMYLLVLASAQNQAEFDEKLSNAINSFNVSLCDDQQILNLLPIAALTRNMGSYSTLKLTCTADANNACTIPAGTRAPYGDVFFVTQTDVVISAGSSQEVFTVCDTTGPVTVLTGEITSFENSIPNLSNVVNLESSVPGKAAESVNSLRQKLIKGNTIKFSIDGCRDAIEALVGINYCRVYFNYNISETITLPGGVVLQPRHAYIVVYGESDDIAKTYVQYMNAPTQNGIVEESHEQIWYTSSGQEFPIKYDTAEEQEIYVKITLRASSDASENVVNQLKRDLIAESANWEIGTNVTEIMTSYLFNNCSYAQVAYTDVSDDGVTWGNVVEIGANVLPRITDANIEVEQEE